LDGGELKSYVDDLLFFLGCVSIVVGVAQMSVAFAWIVAGAEMIVWSLLIGRKLAKNGANIQPVQQQ
jgi:hypothetical protein